MQSTDPWPDSNASKSPFSKDCPQRPYECLISTLRKFPWYMTEQVTVGHRQAIYKATCELLFLLQRAILKGDDPINLNKILYRRVLIAAMECSGFTVYMKNNIAKNVDEGGVMNMSELSWQSFGQPRFAASWLHQYALVPKPGVPLDVVEVSHLSVLVSRPC